MGIIKTFGEWINETFGLDNDGDLQRITASKKIWKALKDAGLSKYFDSAEMCRLNDDSDVSLDFFYDGGPGSNEEENYDYNTQQCGLFTCYDCKLLCDYEFDKDYTKLVIDKFVVCSGIQNSSTDDDSLDIIIKFYPYFKDDNVFDDFGYLEYSIENDTWVWSENYEGDLENDELHSDVAKFISVITEAINPNTKYKLSWFKNEESPVEDNEDTDTYSYTVDDWESGDESEYADFLKKAGATNIKYEHEDEGGEYGDFNILFTLRPGTTIEQLAKKFANVQKRAYPYNDYDEVYFYNKTKHKPLKIVI